MSEDELRAAFEAQGNKATAWGFKRSRKGTYVNPTTARDWKWFQAGAQAERGATFADAYAEAHAKDAS